MKPKTILLTAFALVLSMGMSAMAQTPAAKATDPPKTTTAKVAKPATTTTPAPTAAEIADAKAKGMVWVNTNSKIYHKDGATYGKTKAGKFMTEDDAKKAGFRAARDASPKRPKPVTTATAKSK